MIETATSAYAHNSDVIADAVRHLDPQYGRL